MTDEAGTQRSIAAVIDRPRARWELWKRFSRNQLAVAGAAAVGLMVTLSIAAPVLPLADPNEVITSLRLLPTGSPDHIFGTDSLGRDILSRLIWGGRISIAAGFVTAALSLVIGVSIGLVSGYYGGKLDGWLMRITDIVLAFPALVLAIAVIAVLGPGLTNAMLAVGLIGFPLYARVVRGSVLSIREREYIEAAHAAGASNARIIMRHVLVNVWAPVIVVGTLDVATKILVTSGLSFLGLGSQPPTADWGAMLATSRNFLLVAPHAATIPGLAIFVFALGANLFGDGLRDALDPRLRGT